MTDALDRCHVCGSLLLRHGASQGMCPLCLLRLGESSSRAWEVITLIDETPTAFTYLARHADSDDMVALKRYRVPLTPADRARVERRRDALVALVHDGIARIRDAGHMADGTAYLATSYVRGMPVLDFCRHHALPLETRRQIMLQAADALTYAHRSQVAHGAIRPIHLLIGGLARSPRSVFIDFALPDPPGEPAHLYALDWDALAGVKELVEGGL
jgi:serine/threonine protein kinase